MSAKVFGIGLSKTGTSSLSNALEILGYRSIHFPVSMAEIDSHDASSDISVSYRFSELDRLYPGSKFILTIRDLNQWLESCRKHFAIKVDLHTLSPALSQFLQTQRLLNYGTVNYDPMLFQAAYENHIKYVQDYFVSRPQDLLIMDISGGEGWERLCPFLGCPIPQVKFPQENVDCQYLEDRFKSMTIRLESISQTVGAI